MSDSDGLIEQLQEVRGVTESSTEGLVEEYQTMGTISWAVRRDKEDVQTGFKIDPDGLWDELRDEELWEAVLPVEATGEDSGPAARLCRELSGRVAAAVGRLLREW